MPAPQARPSAPQWLPPDLHWLRRREVWGALLGMPSLLTALALMTVIRGSIGTAVAGFWRTLFGLGAYPIVALLLAWAIWLLAGERLPVRLSIQPAQVVGLEIFLVACLGLLHIPFAPQPGYALARVGGGGGYAGWALAYFLEHSIGRVIGGLLLAAAAIAGAGVALDISWSLVRTSILGLSRPQALPRPSAEPPRPHSSVPEVRVTPAPVADRPAPARTKPVRPPSPPPARQPRRQPRSNRLPSLDLLAPASAPSGEDADIRYQAQTIEETLAHFGVPARIVDTQRGPTVTQFGVEPGFTEHRGANGTVERRKVRVSRIASLADDLALALAAPSIRIEAPVPGRPLVGIEVPNRQPAMVNLRSVMESDGFRRIRSSLRVALGQDVSGSPVAADLATMPHLLIAGATGSGKSVCINALIASLLLENSPETLSLILVDPKRVELTNFDGVPHLVAPVVVETEQTVAALRWLCLEMDRRYKLFAQAQVRHIDGYNASLGRRKGQRIPYLVVCVDELADLMMVAPEEVERSICRLAQMGRATGIHLVLATQRPSIDIVTGLIKANFPARIAFAVSTQVDSRVILDAAGAEQLLGRGDMLYMAPEANRLLRLQGCFVSDGELTAIADYWRQEAGEEEEEAAPLPWAGLAKEGDEDDALLRQALELLSRQEQASTSFLQRRLRIGYSRAARLMEQLEERGVVGPDPGGGRPREVFIEAQGGGPPREPEDGEEEG